MIATSAMLMANAAHVANRTGCSESVPATPGEQLALLVAIPIAIVIGCIAGARYGDPWADDHWLIGFAAAVGSWLLMAVGIGIWNPA